MGTIDNYHTTIISNSTRTFTLNEAVEFMKSLDRYVTNQPVRWVNAKTGNPVTIGYS